VIASAYSEKYHKHIYYQYTYDMIKQGIHIQKYEATTLLDRCGLPRPCSEGDRRRFLADQEAPIRSLIADLSFIKNKQSWGYIFRFGLFEIPEPDFQRIMLAMNVQVSVII
jgi:hypothetical protein